MDCIGGFYLYLVVLKLCIKFSSLIDSLFGMPVNDLDYTKYGLVLESFVFLLRCC